MYTKFLTIWSSLKSWLVATLLKCNLRAWVQLKAWLPFCKRRHRPLLAPRGAPFFSRPAPRAPDSPAKVCQEALLCRRRGSPCRHTSCMARRPPRESAPGQLGCGSASRHTPKHLLTRMPPGSAPRAASAPARRPGSPAARVPRAVTEAGTGRAAGPFVSLHRHRHPPPHRRHAD